MISNLPEWIDVTCVGESTGEKFFGRFEIKKFLTHKEKTEAVRLAETLSRGIEQDFAYKTFLTTLAFLHYHVLKSEANWWKKGDGDIFGMDLFDEEPIWALGRKIKELQKPEEEKSV